MFPGRTLSGRWLLPLAVALGYACAGTATAQDETVPGVPAYEIQPGDVLAVSVWNEPDMQAEVLVRPDGALNFPLVGEVVVANRQVASVTEEIGQRLSQYIPDPVVTIALMQSAGSRFYVIGQVNRPGEFGLSRPIDVMQALSLAGGTTPFAQLDEILVLRRDGPSQVAIPFLYSKVEQGKELEQNILLKSGDTIIVP